MSPPKMSSPAAAAARSASRCSAAVERCRRGRRRRRLVRIEPVKERAAGDAVELDLVAVAMCCSAACAMPRAAKSAQAASQRLDRIDPLHVRADRRVHVAALQPDAAVRRRQHAGVAAAPVVGTSASAETECPPPHQRRQTIAIRVQRRARAVDDPRALVLPPRQQIERAAALAHREDERRRAAARLRPRRAVIRSTRDAARATARPRPARAAARRSSGGARASIRLRDRARATASRARLPQKRFRGADIGRAIDVDARRDRHRAHAVAACSSRSRNSRSADRPVAPRRFGFAQHRRRARRSSPRSPTATPRRPRRSPSTSERLSHPCSRRLPSTPTSSGFSSSGGGATASVTSASRLAAAARRRPRTRPAARRYRPSKSETARGRRPRPALRRPAGSCASTTASSRQSSGSANGHVARRDVVLHRHRRLVDDDRRPPTGALRRATTARARRASGRRPAPAASAPAVRACSRSPRPAAITPARQRLRLAASRDGPLPRVERRRADRSSAPQHEIDERRIGTRADPPGPAARRSACRSTCAGPHVALERIADHHDRRRRQPRRSARKRIDRRIGLGQTHAPRIDDEREKRRVAEVVAQHVDVAAAVRHDAERKPARLEVGQQSRVRARRLAAPARRTRATMRSRSAGVTLTRRLRRCIELPARRGGRASSSSCGATHLVVGRRAPLRLVERGAKRVARQRDARRRHKDARNDRASARRRRRACRPCRRESRESCIRPISVSQPGEKPPVRARLPEPQQRPAPRSSAPGRTQRTSRDAGARRARRSRRSACCRRADSSRAPASRNMAR